MNFLLGANYWSRGWGTEMWRHYDPKQIREELKLLADYGIKDLRVFPNWRDFQPIKKHYTVFGLHGEYVNANTGEPVYDDGVDMQMIDNLRDFCHAAEDNGITLVVSIVTGWMSGRLFCPPALEGKNLITDTEALMLMRRYVHRLVKELKNEKAIVMWDLGNECNCLARINAPNEAYAWTATVTDAIRCEDKTRKIASGMHGLGTDSSCVSGPWLIEHQGELCDILTTHPYPSPTVGGDNEPYNRLRMTLLPTAQSLFYKGISKKEAYIQESGVLTETVGNRDMAADFVRINVLSALANGIPGFQFWCAWEQKHMNYSPYSWSMLERELGLFDKEHQPKKTALEFKSLRKLIDRLPNPFPKRTVDGITVPSRDCEQQNVSISSIILGKQAGIDLDVAFSNNGDIPNAELYFLTQLTGYQVLYKATFDKLISRVNDGAELVITYGGGHLTDFTELIGLKSYGISKDKAHTVIIEDKTLSYTATTLNVSPITAEVLLSDTEGEPVVTKNKYGKGYVYYVNLNVEKQAFDKPDGFMTGNYHLIYKLICDKRIKNKIVSTNNSALGITVNPINDSECLATVLNYTDHDEKCEISIKDGYKINEVIYGNLDTVAACDGLIIKISKIH